MRIVEMSARRRRGWIERTIHPEFGIPYDEYVIACIISNEMIIAGDSQFGRVLAESHYLLEIHNFDLNSKDKCRWWDFQKQEAMEQDWDPEYKRLRDASRRSVKAQQLQALGGGSSTESSGAPKQGYHPAPKTAARRKPPRQGRR